MSNPDNISSKIDEFCHIITSSDNDKIVEILDEMDTTMAYICVSIDYALKICIAENNYLKAKILSKYCHKLPYTKCIERDNIQIFDLFIDTKQPDSTEIYHIYLHAVINNLPKFIIFMINKGLYPVKDSYPSLQSNILFAVASFGDLSLIELFDEAGIVLEYKTDDCLMEIAIEKKHIKIIEYMIVKLGYQISEDSFLESLISGYTEITNLFIQYGYDCTKDFEYFVRTVIENNNLDALKYLVSLGADLLSDGDRYMMVALLSDVSKEMFIYLLENGLQFEGHQIHPHYTTFRSFEMILQMGFDIQNYIPKLLPGFCSKNKADHIKLLYTYGLEIKYDRIEVIKSLNSNSVESANMLLEHDFDFSGFDDKFIYAADATNKKYIIKINNTV